MRTLLSRVAFALTVLAPITVTAAQIDTFQDGTTNGWFAGGGPFGQSPPIPPQAVATGGPNGVGDQFLQVTASSGNGPGSRLVAINQTQWIGDYADAGLTSIEMDLINLGTTDLSIRLQLSDGAGGPPSNQALTSAVLLPSGSGWMHVAFSVAALDLSALLGTPAALLDDVTELRIVHSPTVAAPVPVVGVLGVDNIETDADLNGPVTVAEPVTLALFTAGLLGLAGARRSKQT